MSHLATDNDEGINSINVVPLVDIVLVLLIIFMVTANFIVKPAIELELPRADTGERRERNQFSLVLGRDGSVAIGDRPIRAERIADELARVVAEYKQERRRDLEGGGGSPSDNQLTLLTRKRLTMVIQADTRVSHGRVIYFIDEARKAGIVKYAFNVDPGAAARAPAAVGSLTRR